MRPTSNACIRSARQRFSCGRMVRGTAATRTNVSASLVPGAEPQCEKAPRPGGVTSGIGLPYRTSRWRGQRSV